jgi:hypothetical protein
MEPIKPHDKFRKNVFEMVALHGRRTKAGGIENRRRTEVDSEVSQIWEKEIPTLKDAHVDDHGHEKL